MSPHSSTNIRSTISNLIDVVDISTSYRAKNDLLAFCKNETEAHANRCNIGDLPELIESRFNGKGRMFAAYSNDRIIGCSGLYFSDFSEHIVLLGCRSWITPSFRSKSIIRDSFLPVQKRLALDLGAKQVAISFNNHNKNLRQLFLRNLIKRKPRTPDFLFYGNLNVLDFSVWIKNTPQWVLYERLTNDWDFDWASLRVKQG